MREIEKGLWYVSSWDNSIYVIDVIGDNVIHITYSSNHKIFDLQNITKQEFQEYFGGDEWKTKAEDDIMLLSEMEKLN